jgi:hypothetical protein
LDFSEGIDCLLQTVELSGYDLCAVGGRARLVDNQKLIIERRPVLTVQLAGERDVRPDVVLLENPVPPILEGGLAELHSAADERHKASTGRQPLQRLLDVTCSNLDVLLLAAVSRR